MQVTSVSFLRYHLPPPDIANKEVGDHQFQSSSSSSKRLFCSASSLESVAGDTTFGTITSPNAFSFLLSISSGSSSRSEPEFEERGSGEGRGEIGDNVARNGLEETEMDEEDVWRLVRFEWDDE